MQSVDRYNLQRAMGHRLVLKKPLQQLLTTAITTPQVPWRNAPVWKGDTMRKSAHWLFAACFSISTAASAGPDECREAAEQYKSAVSEVSSALTQYATCVTSSDGTDDCSSEFASLSSAHDDFETAASRYVNECKS